MEENSDKLPFNYFSSAKYKNHIMEKYLRGLDNSSGNNNNNNKCDLELSKWLESAANFTPDKKNYIEWDSRRWASWNSWLESFSFEPIFYFVHRIRPKADESLDNSDTIHLHEKEEIDAAEALTFLAGNCRNRMVT